ncbi:MAG TPA: class D sortase [Terriglobales bacterium]|jgi:sortase A|nr:class D sortase [Terriglobales bacterium]
MRLTLLLPAKTHGFVRWSRRLCLLIGILALTYVGCTLLEARLYQASAEQSLETQIQQHKVTADVPRLASCGRDGCLPEFKPPVKKGDVLGLLDIPRLGLTVAVLQGTSSRILRLGAGHIEGTPLPGEAGNSAIAGHRDTFFRDLKDIRPKDEIQLQTATTILRYEVDWVKVVDPDDLSVLAPSTESALTLVTCYPFYLVGPAPRRFVVRAHQN